MHRGAGETTADTPAEEPAWPPGAGAAGRRGAIEAEGEGLACVDVESAAGLGELPEVATAAPPAPASRPTAATATRVSGCPYRRLGGGPLADVTAECKRPDLSDC